MIKTIWNAELTTGMTEDEMIKAGVIERQGHYPKPSPCRVIMSLDEECNECVEQAVVEGFNFALLLTDHGKDGAVHVTMAQDNLTWDDLDNFLSKARPALDTFIAELYTRLHKEQDAQEKTVVPDDELWIPNMETSDPEVEHYHRRHGMDDGVVERDDLRIVEKRVGTDWARMGTYTEQEA